MPPCYILFSFFLREENYTQKYSVLYPVKPFVFALLLSKELVCAPFCRKNANRSWHGRNLTASPTHMMMRFPPLHPTLLSRPGAAGEGSALRSTQKRTLSAMCARSASCKYLSGWMLYGSYWQVIIQKVFIENEAKIWTKKVWILSRHGI